MKNLFDTYKPAGFHSVSSYLFVEDPEELIDFLKRSFYAIEIDRTMQPNSDIIANVILKIGDTCFMLSQAREPFLGMRTSFYLYVADVDAIYKNAIAQGGKSVFEPANQDYDDRQAGIEDPAGNYWWISTRLKKTNY